MRRFNPGHHKAKHVQTHIAKTNPLNPSSMARTPNVNTLSMYIMQQPQECSASATCGNSIQSRKSVIQPASSLASAGMQTCTESIRLGHQYIHDQLQCKCNAQVSVRVCSQVRAHEYHFTADAMHCYICTCCCSLAMHTDSALYRKLPRTVST